jgi:4-hydroxybenzoate polyprenyltransferase
VSGQPGATTKSAVPQEARGPSTPRWLERLYAYARLVRIEYCALGAAGVALGAYLITGAAPEMPVILSAAAVFFVAAGCYSFDDLSDLAGDKLNERTDRPLVTGVVTLREAKATGSIAFALALAAAITSGAASGLLIGLGAMVAMVYNRWLQGLIPLKNVLFAGAFPVPLLIGWLAAGGTPGPLFLYAIVLVFTVGLGFETMIDVADAEGDRRSGVATFATRYGTRLSSQVSATLHMMGAALVLLLYVLPVDTRLQGNELFLALAAVAALSNTLIGVALTRNHSAPHVLALKRRAFLVLTTGVAAIFIGLFAGTL